MTLSPRWQWASSLAVALVVALALTTLPSAGQIAPTGNNQPITFTKHVAPILQQRCQQCHRPDSLAPMSLTTFEEVRPFARAMKARISLRGKQGVMPPWHVEKARHSALQG